MCGVTVDSAGRAIRRAILTFSDKYVHCLFVSIALPTADPANADPSPDGPHGCSDAAFAARAERRLRVLAELADIGMEISRALRERVAQQVGEDETKGDPGLAFSRIARAVRQTLALDAKLDQERQVARGLALAHLAEAQAKVERAAAHERLRGLIRKSVVRDAVEQAIDDQAEGDDVERLVTDLRERLDDEDEYDALDFNDRPIGEMVVQICRDLGLTIDLSLWEDEEWAIEEAEARTAGSPYAFRRPEPPPWRGGAPIHERHPP